MFGKLIAMIGTPSSSTPAAYETVKTTKRRQKVKRTDNFPNTPTNSSDNDNDSSRIESVSSTASSSNSNSSFSTDFDSIHDLDLDDPQILKGAVLYLLERHRDAVKEKETALKEGGP